MSYDVEIRPKSQPPSVDYYGNVTYNVTKMLRLAGIHPEVMNGLDAGIAHTVVVHALAAMEANPDYFRQFEAENGWGTYETTLDFVKQLEVALLYLDDDAHRYQVEWQ